MNNNSYYPSDEIDGSDGNVRDFNSNTSLESSRIPKVGMYFSSDEEAYDFYNTYAKNSGFGVRKGASAKDDNGVVIRRIFVCHREGFKYSKHKRKDGQEVKPRKSERGGCCARLHVHKQEDGLWKVKYFIDRHNHPMITSPSELSKLKSHSKERVPRASEPLVIPLEIARPISIRIGDDYQLGIEHLGMSRECNLTDESRSMIQQILNRQATEYAFFYSTRVDEGFKLTSAFWADHNSRLAYMKLSDVLVFDIAYRIDNFLLPFATFTGINQHKKPTLFGCALLGDEKEETLVWLFQSFISCMGDKAPVAIVTKQDPIVCKAVKKVFPRTRHRFCMQEIRLQEDRFLHPLRSSYNPSFDEDYNKFTRRSQTIEESERCWLLLKDKYMVNFEARVCRRQMNELKAWDWLESMYKVRHKWVESYLNDVFFAGIRSIESSYFDGFIDSMTPVHEFILQFDKATSFHRTNEEKDDFSSIRSKLDFQEMSPLEAFAAKVYTNNVFDIFQLEFKSTVSCLNDEVGMREGFIIYKVVGKTSDGDAHLVKCRVSDTFCTCSCSKFETEGIPCKHILYIMIEKLKLNHIPEQYILGRWTLSSGIRLNDEMNINAVDHRKITPFESSLFQAKLNMVFEKATEDREYYKLAHALVDEFWKRVELVNQIHK